MLTEATSLCLLLYRLQLFKHKAGLLSFKLCLDMCAVFLYWRAWRWPEYRPKHLAHTHRHNLDQINCVMFDRITEMYSYCYFLCVSLAVSSLFCILELSRPTRIENGSQKHNYICNIQGVSVYTNVSSNYMFRPN